MSNTAQTPAPWRSAVLQEQLTTLIDIQSQLQSIKAERFTYRQLKQLRIVQQSLELLLDALGQDIHNEIGKEV